LILQLSRMMRYQIIILLFLATGALKAELRKDGASIHKDTLSISGYPESTFGIFIPAVSENAEIRAVIYLFGDSQSQKPLINEYKNLAQEFSMVLVYIHPNLSETGIHEKFKSINTQLSNWIPGAHPDIYTAGQGNSASIAFQVAIKNTKVRGMIGVNLLEDTVEEIKNEFRRDLDFVGLAGVHSSSYYFNEDLKKYFTTYRLKYKGLIYDGSRDWPDSDNFWETLDWLKFVSAREHPKSNVKYLANRFQSDFGAAILSEKKQTVQSYHDYREILIDYDKFFNTDAVVSRLEVLDKSKKHQQKFKEAEKFKNMEANRRRKYEWTIKQYRVMTLDTSFQKSLKWWESELDELTRMASSRNVYKSNLGHRLLDYLSRATERSCDEYISKMDYYTALKMNEIWIYIHPDASKGYYNRAKLYARQYQLEETLAFLERAYELGLSSVDLSEEDSFTFLNGNFRYHQILHGVNSRK